MFKRQLLTFSCFFVPLNNSTEFLVPLGSQWEAAITQHMALPFAGNRDRSGHLFRHIVVSVGLSGRRTERPPGLLFRELLEPVLHRLGP
jgi:hypothetical protein